MTVSGGLFNVLLGSVTELSIDDFDGTARWLELVVEGETLNPRVRIVSVPYAIQAEEAKNLAGLACGDGQIAEWNNTTHQWECGDDDTGAGGDFWSLTGNAGTTPGTHFLGTTDEVSLTLAVNGAAALRLEPNATSPNVIGGYSGNTVTSGVVGATIGGGGASGSANNVTDILNAR